MKKIRFLLPVLACCISLISGCKSSEVDESKNVNQERIYQDYYVEYDHAKDKYKVEAIFRFGGANGTTLILSEPSEILFNGEKMEGKKVLLRGFVYKSEDKTGNPGNYAFSFTDLNERSFKNSIDLREVDFEEIPKDFSLSKDFSITWKGDELSNAEELWVEIKAENGVSKTIFVKNDDLKTINISPQALREFSTGKGEARLVRFIRKNADNSAEIGGEMSGRFYSDFSEIRFVE